MPTEPKKKAAPRAAATRAKKKAEPAAAAPAPEAALAMTKENTVAAIGRRKTAVARVRLIRGGKGTIRVNEKAMATYFPTFDMQRIVLEPLRAISVEQAYDVSIRAQGGGAHAQAEASRLGIARALLKEQPDARTTLKKLGFLTRDSRAKERKKPGLKRARRAPQWSKR